MILLFSFSFPYYPPFGCCLPPLSFLMGCLYPQTGNMRVRTICSFFIQSVESPLGLVNPRWPCRDVFNGLRRTPLTGVILPSLPRCVSPFFFHITSNHTTSWLIYQSTQQTYLPVQDSRKFLLFLHVLFFKLFVSAFTCEIPVSSVSGQFRLHFHLLSVNPSQLNPFVPPLGSSR